MKSIQMSEQEATRIGHLLGEAILSCYRTLRAKEARNEIEQREIIRSDVNGLIVSSIRLPLFSGAHYQVAVLDKAEKTLHEIFAWTREEAEENHEKAITWALNQGEMPE